MNRSKSFSSLPADEGRFFHVEPHHAATNPWTTARGRARSQGSTTINGLVRDMCSIKFTPSSSWSSWRPSILPDSSSAWAAEDAEDSEIADHTITLPEPRTAGDTSGCSLTSSCMMSADTASATTPLKEPVPTEIKNQKSPAVNGSWERVIKPETSSPVFGPNYDIVLDSSPAGEYEYALKCLNCN